MGSYRWKIENKGIELLFYLLAFFLFGYVLLRAFLLQFTIDESVSFLTFVTNNNLKSIITAGPPSANNHILNTLLMRLSLFVFGNHEWALRLPNVLSFVLYLYFSFKISCLLSPLRRVQILGFAALCANPYMIEFFSLARGYGLSLGLMMGSLYFFYEYLKNTANKSLLISLLFSALAIYANFSILNYFIGLLSALFFNEFFIKFDLKKVLIRTCITVISIIIIAILIAIPIKKMRAAKELYFGGTNNFFDDTIMSLVENSLYGRFSEGSQIVFYLSLFLVFAMFFFICACLFQLLIKKEKNNFIICIILIISILSPIIQFELLETKFLIQRTALFYYPLCILVSMMAITFLYTYFNKKIIISFFAQIFVFFILFNFFKNINLKSSHEWFFDTHTRAIFDDLSKYKNKQALKVGVHPLFVHSFNYYLVKRKIDWVEKIPDLAVQSNEIFDFYYVRKEDIKQLSPKYQQILVFEEGEYALFKKI